MVRPFLLEALLQTVLRLVEDFRQLALHALVLHLLVEHPDLEKQTHAANIGA